MSVNATSDYVEAAWLVDSTEHSSTENNAKKCNRKLCIGLIVTIIVLAIVSILTYYFIFYKQNSNTNVFNRYDFIIIGSGPAGSVVASRLASNGYSVLLLESGNTTQLSLNGTLAASSNTNLTLFDIPLEWDILSENHSYTSTYIYSPTGSTLPQCGRGIGGSGSINAMIYIRGTISDFTAENGWIGEWNNYTNILQYYMRSENNSNIFDSPYHNNSGNVHISHNFNHKSNKLSNAFLDACKDRNHVISDDLNFPNRAYNVCGNYQFLIFDDSYRTKRYSVAQAFYGNGIKPKNLIIKANAMVIDIIFDNEDKTRAIGVNYVDLNDNQKLKKVYALKEIVISAGTLNTPSILMQSGIGDADILKNTFKFKDEDIILNNTNVGQNYIDGVFTHIIWNVTDDLIDNFSLCTPWGSTFGADDAYYVHKCREQWNAYVDTNVNNYNETVFDETGFNVGGFFKSPYSSDPSSNDIQITLQPFDILYRYNKTNILTAQIANNLPFSKGYLKWNHLNDINDLDNIVIDGSNVEIIGNYLENKNDINALVFGINVTRDIFQSTVIGKYIVNELSPGDHIASDDALEEYVIANKESADHVAGTSKMGYVVDEELKVIGLKNVRIADASVMPSLPSGNTHATCMMVGEYAAHKILTAQL